MICNNYYIHCPTTFKTKMEITPCEERVPVCNEVVVKDDVLCLPHKIVTIETLITNQTNNQKLQNGFNKCSNENCFNKARYKNGKCNSHGELRRCNFNGCVKLRQAGLYCKNHGGKHTNTKCKEPNCERFNQGGGFCYSHGGGIRCSIENCSKRAISTKCKVCKDHLTTIKTTKLLEMLIK